MEQLHLTFAPIEQAKWEDFFLENEKNVERFLLLIDNILFNDYCKLYYSPTTQKYLSDVFDVAGEALNAGLLFFNILDKAKNVVPIDERDTKLNLYEWLGDGNTAPVENKEIGLLFGQKFGALILPIPKKNFDNHVSSIIAQTHKRTASMLSIEYIIDYHGFLDWANSCHPRRFDEQYTRDKHFNRGFIGSSAENPLKRGESVAMVRCDLSEVKETLHRAFHKIQDQNRDHEDFLFFYDGKIQNYPILLFKASRSSPDTTFNFHAYHISESELKVKYKIDPKTLKNKSIYVLQSAT